VQDTQAFFGKDIIAFGIVVFLLLVDLTFQLDNQIGCMAKKSTMKPAKIC